jgi:hypothetical protein
LDFFASHASHASLAIRIADLADLGDLADLDMQFGLAILVYLAILSGELNLLNDPDLRI